MTSLSSNIRTQPHLNPSVLTVSVCSCNPAASRLLSPPSSSLTPVCICPQRWVVSRQMRFEGGFQGRCNKLVDGCYSFWQAGLLPLLQRALLKEGRVGFFYNLIDCF